jgi:hypothetical protein
MTIEGSESRYDGSTPKMSWIRKKVFYNLDPSSFLIFSVGVFTVFRIRIRIYVFLGQRYGSGSGSGSGSRFLMEI